MNVSIKKSVTEQVQQKLDLLVDELIESIDVDLLSNAEKIVYLKTIIGHSIPKKESVSMKITDAPDAIKWLVNKPESQIESLVNGVAGRFID